VTFVSALKLAGMDKCKKFSLVSNFQDAAMARNRILFDLADEVGVPYSSDSRFIDLYTNGVYQGTYQICQKIDVGKNTLIPDFEEDDYLDTATGGVKSDFSFVAEIDSSPSADDFHFNASNGNNLTMKAPELASDDPNYSAARSYIRTKYNSMYNNLQKATVAEYLDITSMAEVYIINELGKNWDSGASSFYFTYKPDADGKYKFFASPVWDYDNSLGNARGVSYDLYNLGINDYTLPTGWFASKKNGYTGPNVLAESVKNPLIMAEVRRVWFEEFVPAIKTLTSKGIGSGELYSSDVYADILRGTAGMNYKIWPIDTNGSWTADHGSLLRYSADYTENTYGQVTGVTLNLDSSSTSYDQYTFDGQFDYMMDWLTSRAAWMSAQYISGYTPSEPIVKPTEEPTQEPTQEPTLPAEDIIEPELTGALVAWIFDSADKTSGNKLTEYGSSDEGYAATLGSGKLTLTVSGEKSRALEWSEPEYGKSGALITPIISAGSKNPWGSPYVRFEIPATEYEDMSLTLYLAGSNKCPAEWKLQYSTDGETFTDIEGAVAKISPDSRKLLTAYFDKTALPDFKYDCFHNTVILQLVPTSMTTVEGGDATVTPSSGELAINDAVLYGAKLDYDDVRMGDVDLSGDADMVDVTYLQRYSIKMYSITARQLKAADVLRDGEVDITDVTYLQRQLTSGGGSL
ncbi:MAG: CotH kinase family protein, partial [Ruminococcus sp.]|nr:CotH kinase family protein [Ruminococcus sp.]